MACHLALKTGVPDIDEGKELFYVISCNQYWVRSQQTDDPKGTESGMYIQWQGIT